MFAPLLTSALSTAIAAWALTARGAASRGPAVVVTRGQRQRLQRLRSRSPAFALGGEWLAESAPFGRWVPVKLENVIEGRLRRLGPAEVWTARAWLATVVIEGLVIGLLASLLAGYFGAGGAVAAALGPLLWVVWTFARWRRLASRGKKRVGDCRSLLPFAIDGIGLVIKSGAGLTQAIRMAAGSYRETPLGEELRDVIDRLDGGEPLGDALVDFRDRLRIDEVDEFVMAASCTHTMGADIGDALLDMAARMRERRSRQIETEAGKAQVQLYYPGMLLLLVCLVAVVAPFVAPACGFFEGISP